MNNKFNSFLDSASEYLSRRKGMLPLAGILFVILNYIFQFLPFGWVSSTNLFLHLGFIVAIIGVMIAWAL